MLVNRIAQSGTEVSSVHHKPERRLTAIMHADASGYSRLMGENEEAAFRTLSAHRKIIDRLIENRGGRFVNSAGDSVLAEFASVVEAVSCAVEIQTLLKAENENLPRLDRMEFRIGVNLGDVMVERDQIYGDGVNVAARLGSLAAPGGISISGTVYEQVRDKLTFSYEDSGEQVVKNIPRPVHVWRLVLDGNAAARRRYIRTYYRGATKLLVGIAISAAGFIVLQHLLLRPHRTSASMTQPEKPSLTGLSMPSIAVLPLANLSGDPQQEYFSDSISVQLTAELSRLPHLLVIARNSSFAYKGKAIKEREIGRGLGVNYLLEGSVHKAAGQIRIRVELVDAHSATEMWVQNFDRPLRDFFAVQDEIVGKVVTTLGLIFKLQEIKAPWSNARPTDNPEAYDDYLRADEYLWRFTKDDNAKARQWSEKAINLDSNFIDAYVVIGWTYFFDGFWTKDPQAIRPELDHLLASAQKALALDDSNCGALALMTRYHVLRSRQFERAIADAKRAVATNPNCSTGYEFLSDTLTSAGRPLAVC
jgi:adenylate cyclase